MGIGPMIGLDEGLGVTIEAAEVAKAGSSGRLGPTCTTLTVGGTMVIGVTTIWLLFPAVGKVPHPETQKSKPPIQQQATFTWNRAFGIS
jgi:hypothetical protein